MLRRKPRRIRSANRLCGFLPVVISVVTLFFPFSGNEGELSGKYGSYWSTKYDGTWWALFVWPAKAEQTTGASGGTGCSVRCVRAREEQAVPLFWIMVFFGLWNFGGIGRSSKRSLGRLRSVSGLFSNPPGVKLLPVMLRRQPRRIRSANRHGSFLPAVIQWLLFFSRCPGV